MLKNSPYEISNDIFHELQLIFTGTRIIWCAILSSREGQNLYSFWLWYIFLFEKFRHFKKGNSGVNYQSINSERIIWNFGIRRFISVAAENSQRFDTRIRSDFRLEWRTRSLLRFIVHIIQRNIPHRNVQSWRIRTRSFLFVPFVNLRKTQISWNISITVLVEIAPLSRNQACCVRLLHYLIGGSNTSAFSAFVRENCLVKYSH